jgi:DNA polymerase-3 subunit gamma/tau
MMEATKIKEIDEMIETLEAKIQTKPQPRKENIVTLTPEPEKRVSQPTTPQPPVTKPAKPAVNTTEVHYKELITKLYDRNYELGECFEKSISFVSYEENILTLMSCASENCKKLLRLSSGIIKHFVKESFTLDTKIAMKACDKTIPEPPQQEENSHEESKNIENPHPADSCIANQTVGNSENAEIDGENILENPFVKKAGELFEPSRIIVKSKI